MPPRAADNIIRTGRGKPVDQSGKLLYSRFGSQIIDVRQSYYAPERKMKLEILPLTEENLRDAPEWGSHPFSCKYCLYWELPEELSDPEKEKKEDMFQKKLKWLSQTRRRFGDCGRIAYLDGSPSGYAQYAPPNLLPNSANYHSGPPSEDAVFIGCLFIPDSKLRRLGLGSQILLSIVNELRERGVRAVETFARKGNPNNPSGAMEFYLKNGFRIYKDDKEFPLMRLDL